MFYLVRASVGIEAKDVYFEDALEHIRQKGLWRMQLCKVEIDSLVEAAHRRGRIDELDAAVAEGREACAAGEMFAKNRP